MDRTTCSRELEPLVQTGLIEIQVGKDRRQRVVRLLPKGARKLAKGRPYWEAVQKRVASTFGSENTHELLRQLRDLLNESARLQVH
jgi:DNA-binding MarR family transcriptional regulator